MFLMCRFLLKTKHAEFPLWNKLAYTSFSLVAAEGGGELEAGDVSFCTNMQYFFHMCIQLMTSLHS